VTSLVDEVVAIVLMEIVALVLMEVFADDGNSCCAG
jgi:hypothetical protein